MTLEAGQLWERVADSSRGTQRTYLLLDDAQRNAWGVRQVVAYCFERSRVERFNAASLMNEERWRKL